MIVKKCKTHGDLTEKEIHQKGKSPTGKQYYGCLHCKRVAQVKYRDIYPDKVKEQNYKRNQARKNNPEWRDKKRKWERDYQARKRITRPEEVRLKDREYKKKIYPEKRQKILEQHKIMRDNLMFSYVKNCLKKNGFEDPQNELIHAKANIMLLKREIMIQNVNKGKNKYVKKTGQRKRGYPNRDAERKIIEGSTENFIKRKSV